MFLRSYLFVIFLCFLLADAALGFSVRIHGNVTNEVLSEVSITLPDGEINFSDRALLEIVAANGSVDYVTPAIVCKTCHFVDESFAGSATRLKDKKTEIINVLSENPPNGAKARILFGQALHTLQDYYSHSNWVERGNSGVNSSLGRGSLSNPPLSLMPCEGDPSILGNAGGGGDTSGYFIALVGCGNLSEGKCAHGTYKPACVGINKDLDAAEAAGEGVPSSSNHGVARNIAKMATLDYYNQIIEEIAGNERALRAFLDARGVVGFVIDDTGSMADEIGAVKSIVTTLVNLLDSNPITRPPGWLLERFGDPDVGSPFVTDSSSEILAAVNSLSAGGGDDCPELAFTALLRAIDSASPDSYLFLFTDADPKDSGLVYTVAARARAKGVLIFPIISGSCTGFNFAGQGNSVAGSANSLYRLLAEQTGGMLMDVSPVEIPDLVDIFETQIFGNVATIASLNGDIALGETKTVGIPIDSNVEKLEVQVSIESGGAISLRRPSGVLVLPTDPDVRITSLNSVHIFSVANPAVGQWSLVLNDSGRYSVLVRALSLLDFTRFDFVRPNDDIHGGFFPIDGLPLAGRGALGDAVVSGPFSTATFSLVNESGDLLRKIDLTRDFPRAYESHFVGPISLPSVPFRIQVTGLDLTGVIYQRQQDTLYRAQTVLVSTDETNDYVPVGQLKSLRFTIENLGSPGSFNISAADDLGSIVDISESAVFLKTGQVEEVFVRISVPESIVEETAFRVTLTATRADDQEVYNSASVPLVALGVAPIVDVPVDSNFTLLCLAIFLASAGLVTLRGGRLF